MKPYRHATKLKCVGATVIEFRFFNRILKKKKKNMGKLMKITHIIILNHEEEEEEEKQHGQNVKTIFSSNLKSKWYFSDIFYTQFCFDMFYVKSSEVETESKN